MSVMVFSAIAQGFLDTADFVQRRAAAQADKMLKRVNAEASNRVRDSSNELSAANSSLSEFMRTTGNQRLMKYGGEQSNAISQNLGRVNDQLTQGTLSNRIKAAEQLGSLSAMAAAAGVGGAAVNAIDMTLRLRNAVTQQQIEDNGGYVTYDLIQKRAGVIANASQSGNYSQSVAALDYTEDVPSYTAIPSWTSFAFEQFAKAGGGKMMAQGGATGGKGGEGGVTSSGLTPQMYTGNNYQLTGGNVGSGFGQGGAQTFFGLSGNSGIGLRP